MLTGATIRPRKRRSGLRSRSGSRERVVVVDRHVTSSTRRIRRFARRLRTFGEGPQQKHRPDAALPESDEEPTWRTDAERDFRRQNTRSMWRGSLPSLRRSSVAVSDPLRWIEGRRVSDRKERLMGWLEALVLGIVQGLTEFLPISSSAHQSIVGQFFGGEDPGSAFTAITQLGTESAVIIYFRKDIWLIIKNWSLALIGKLPRNDPEARMGWLVIIGSIPIVILGLLFQDAIDHRRCGTCGPPPPCWPASASSSASLDHFAANAGRWSP